MKHWTLDDHDSLGRQTPRATLNDNHTNRVISVTVADKIVVIREECDQYFTAACTPTEAIEAVLCQSSREVNYRAWFEGYTCPAGFYYIRSH